MGSHYHIRRQRWHLRAPDRAAAFSLRALLRHDLDSLNSIIEHSLDAVDNGEAVIHIPRLELQLHITDSSELAEQLGLVLKAQLAEHRIGLRGENGGPDMQTSAAHQRQRLLGFLQRGELKWHEQGTDAPAMIRQMSAELEAWLASHEDVWSALCEAAPATLEAATAFFLRLINLLPPEAQLKLIQTAQAAPTAQPSAAPAASGREATLSLLHKLVVLNPGTYAQRYLQALQLAVLAAHAPPVPGALFIQVERILGRQTSRDVMSPAESSPHALADKVAASPRKTPVGDDGAATRPVPPQDHAAPADPASALLSPVIASLFAPAEDQAPGLRVHMAGLVLLHAYLPRLFEACRIELDEQGLIAPPSLARAAALLHRLVSGREEIHEFELGLIKPLLGLTPDTPLAVAPGLLDEADVEEYAALLAAVISHWSVLRSTSADGLRISFLQRQGLLHDSGGHWQLHVESEAFDVLLAQLPWSISLIKLPWMTKPIFTDWPTR